MQRVEARAIVLDVNFIQGRPKETRLALLKDINTRVAAAAGVSPDDMMITLYEVPGENISFGQGLPCCTDCCICSRPVVVTKGRSLRPPTWSLL